MGEVINEAGSDATPFDEYQNDGFYVARNLLRARDFEDIERVCLSFVEDFSGVRFPSLTAHDFIDYISGDRAAETHLYDNIRDHKVLQNLALNPKITALVKTFLRKERIILLQKIPFRIDCPLTLRELAVWHQDYYYVKGSPETVTVWVPLYDVDFKEGCLMVMPASHKLGPIDHDVNVLKKKFYPSTIFDLPVRYVEVNQGDAVIFHSCLLHSSGNNISDTIRFSIQARYTAANSLSNPNMGERILVA